MEFFGLKFHLPQKFVFEITPCGKKVSSAPEFVILDKILPFQIQVSGFENGLPHGGNFKTNSLW